MKHAFTLIELLVVISVIAVLAGLLIPVAGRIRAHAELTGCSSNLSQFAQAIVAYSNANAGAIPSQGQLNGSETGLTQYMSFGASASQGFYQSTHTKCPTLAKYYLQFPGNNGKFSDLNSTHTGIGNPASSAYHLNVSYAASTSIHQTAATTTGIGNITQVLDQTKCAFVFCGDMTWNTPPVGVAAGVRYTNSAIDATLVGPQFPHKTAKTYGNDNAQGWTNYYSSAPYKYPVLRDGVVNILHADGHVSSKKITLASGPYDEDKYLCVDAGGNLTTAGTNLQTASKRAFQYCWNRIGSSAPPTNWVP